MTSCVAVSKSFVSKLPSPADGALMPPRSNLNAATCLPDEKKAAEQARTTKTLSELRSRNAASPPLD